MRENSHKTTLITNEHVQIYEYTENIAKEQNAVDQTFLGAFCKTEK